MLNYLRGAKICVNNSDRLATSGRIIIKDDNGTKAFGLFLLYIAYEEMAKAIFCFFIHKGWLTSSFANKVFRDHEPKIFLLDEFFLSFEVKNNVPYLGGEKMGLLPLNHFISKHKQKIKNQRRLTTDLIYVNNNEKWHIPFRDVKKISKKIDEITTQTLALHSLFHALQEEIDSPNLSNFRLAHAQNGRITISYTSKPQNT